MGQQRSPDHGPGAVTDNREASGHPRAASPLIGRIVTGYAPGRRHECTPWSPVNLAADGTSALGEVPSSCPLPCRREGAGKDPGQDPGTRLPRVAHVAPVAWPRASRSRRRLLTPWEGWCDQRTCLVADLQPRWEVVRSPTGSSGRAHRLLPPGAWRVDGPGCPPSRGRRTSEGRRARRTCRPPPAGPTGAVTCLGVVTRPPSTAAVNRVPRSTGRPRTLVLHRRGR